jgi:flavin reductase (DIM6/NTAB) family NADH-FMN oxidoreductase RutF
MADETAHIYEPREGHGMLHDPFNAIVGPRPIGWISTVDRAGIANLAPYSFFNAFNYKPPIIGFSTIGWKDSVANVDATGEFCWSLATKALAQEMNLTCAPAPPEIDEFDVSGLTRAPSRRIAAPCET